MSRRLPKLTERVRKMNLQLCVQLYFLIHTRIREVRGHWDLTSSCDFAFCGCCVFNGRNELETISCHNINSAVIQVQSLCWHHFPATLQLHSELVPYLMFPLCVFLLPGTRCDGLTSLHILNKLSSSCLINFFLTAAPGLFFF